MLTPVAPPFPPFVCTSCLPFQDALAAFRATLRPTLPKEPTRPTKKLLDERRLPSFLNGRRLRDYQEVSLHWMLGNYRGEAGAGGGWEPRNCILGDEVGVGGVG